MTTNKSVSLTCQEHSKSLCGLFSDLYDSQKLADCTLFFPEGSLKAHRIVLSSRSKYFQSLFDELKFDNPVIVLKGVSMNEMRKILEFMYKGVVGVFEEQLESLLDTASFLQIKELEAECSRISRNKRKCSMVETLSVKKMREMKVADKINEEKEAAKNIKDTSIKENATIIEEKLKKPAPDKVIQPEKVNESKNSIKTFKAPTELEKPSEKKKVTNSGGPESELIIKLDKSLELPKVSDQIKNSENEKQLQSQKPAEDKPADATVPKRETRFKGQKRVDVQFNFPHVRMKGRSSSIYKEMKKADEKDVVDGDTPRKIVTKDGNTADIRLQIKTENQDIESENQNSGGPTSSFEKQSESDDSNKSRVDSSSEENKLEQSGSTSEVRRYECDYCSNSFTRFSHLTRHRRLHTGDRPFACQLCPETFTRNDALKVHQKWHKRNQKKPKILKKTEVRSEENSNYVTVTVKKGRGRPRKPVDPNIVKRPVGRPRKDQSYTETPENYDITNLPFDLWNLNSIPLGHTFENYKQSTSEEEDEKPLEISLADSLRPVGKCDMQTNFDQK